MRARQISILLLLAFGLGLMAGLRAELHASAAKDQRLAAHAAVAQLQDAKARGDELTLQLASAERQIHTLTKEKRDALRNTTFGRACLGAAALRVLDGAAGLRVAGLPAAASSAADSGGAVAAYSSDRDVGQWALDAGAQFELCRGRLGALIQWHQGVQR